MSYKLVIVESPAKAKKIEGYLGPGYKVMASIGHIRDLPTDDMGVDLETLRPRYIIPKDKQPVVSRLKTAAKGASEVILATDLDREGEAIAFHLMRVLGLENPPRVAYNEITRTAITKAMANPGQIDKARVAAQECRRILDRLVGYTLSPQLSELADRPMSAGRVQSPALKVVVDREREIERFQSQTHYSLKLVVDGLELKFDKAAFGFDGSIITDPRGLQAIADELTEVRVAQCETKDKTQSPKGLLTTSELQQIAASKLDIGSDVTMAAAQKLYEAGLITYHRTDDPNISDEGWDQVAAYLSEKGEAVSAQRRRWAIKDNAQEAHEGIRVTDPATLPISVAGDNDTQRQVFQLIRERTLAAVAADGIDTVTQVVMQHPERDDVRFKARGVVVKEPGFRQFLKLSAAEKQDSELPWLPEAGKTYPVQTIELLTLETEPPKRYTLASLTKKLEGCGIGRPSTYATIFSNLFRRQYMTAKSAKAPIIPTPIGRAVVDALSPFEFIRLNYTANLETDLDRIAQGQAKYSGVIAAAWGRVQEDLPKLTTFDRAAIEAVEAENRSDCPRCQNALKRIPKKDGKTFLWVHVDEAHVAGCQQFIDDVKGQPYIAELQNHSCPLCDTALVRRFSQKKKKHFWFHSHTEGSCSPIFEDKAGKPVFDKMPCPQCAQPLKRLKSNKPKEERKPGQSAHFWVHIGDPGECRRFTPDKRGKPVAEVEA